MADVTQIRQKVQQARGHIAKGELAKARAILKGIDHPKAQALLAEVEAQLAQKPQASFPIIPFLGFLGVFLLLAIGGGVVLMGGQPTPTPEPLPTLMPTADCTSETVRGWWGVQNVALDTFVADASAASRTMPGERLTERISALRQFRADFPALPECASSEMQTAIADLLQAMDDTIAALEAWANGADAVQTANTLTLTERALRDARGRAGR